MGEHVIGRDGAEQTRYNAPSMVMKSEIVPGTATTEFETEERCFIIEHWNDPRDPDVSIARARVPRGVTTALHRLDVDERYIVIEGRGRMEVEGAPSREIGEGDVVLVPAGRAQRVENIGDCDLLFHCICTPRFEPRCYHACE